MGVTGPVCAKLLTCPVTRAHDMGQNPSPAVTTALPCCSDPWALDIGAPGWPRPSSAVFIPTTLRSWIHCSWATSLIKESPWLRTQAPLQTLGVHGWPKTTVGLAGE